MNKTKKFISTVLVLMMMVIIVTPVFAAGNSGIITIKNAEPEKTYKAYRLFDLSFDGKSHYGYTLSSQWKPFFLEGAGKTMVNIDENNGNVTLKNTDSSSVQALAQAAKLYAETHHIIAEREYTTKVNETIVEFNGLDLGYYLVTTGAGGLCALDTTDTAVEMFEKNTAPTINKSADKTNAAYGDTVHYTIPFTKGAYVWGDYIITDIMTGLDMTNDQISNIKITDGKNDIAINCQINYYKNSPENGSNTLQVVIPKRILEQYKSGAKFILEYDAIVKKTIAMDNKVTMKYQNGPEESSETPVYEVKVANYEFIIKKTDEQGELLNGATFELYTNEKCTEESRLKFVQENGKYRLAEKNETGETKITAGKAIIEGLAADVYYLKEIAAPEGYNKLIKPVKIEIIANINNNQGSPYYNQAFNDQGERLDPTVKMNEIDVSKVGSEFVLTVVNKTGIELPFSGGIGTAIFYVIGSALILIAVISLIIKKYRKY